jgi:hypothetical protein
MSKGKMVEEVLFHEDAHYIITWNMRSGTSSSTRGRKKQRIDSSLTCLKCCEDIKHAECEP